MIDRTLAKRYAKALLDVAVQRKTVRETEEQIVAIGKLWGETKDLREVMGHPSVRSKDKAHILREVFEKRVTRDVMEFLVILLEGRRLDLLPEIGQSYDELADAYEGLVRVEVRSFLPLSPEERKRLVDTLGRITGGRTVSLLEQEDKGLLGGMTVRIGDVLVDGSVAGRLKTLKEMLAAQRP